MTEVVISTRSSLNGEVETMGTTKIMWCSRHAPHKKHKRLLEEIYRGDNVQIVHRKELIRDASKLVQEYKESGCCDIFVNATPPILTALVEAGVRPLISIDEPGDVDDHDFKTPHDYKRIKEIVRFERSEVITSTPRPFGAAPYGGYAA